MGRGFEILIVPLGAAALLSIMAVFAAFFNRTAAKLCVGGTLGIIALFLLLIMMENRWNFGWMLFLLMEASWPFLIMYGSLLLSAVAIWAPLRRPGLIRPDGTVGFGRPKWRLLLLASGITVMGTAYGVSQWIDGQRGEEKTRKLLAGDRNLLLSQMGVEYQQRRVICTDPEVLRYMEERFRTHEPDPQFLGTSYELLLTYEGGGSQAFYCYCNDTGDINVYLGEPGEGGIGHGIHFTHPRPRGVEELVSFLLKPYREVAGSVLILEAGGSRIEQDKSLIAR